MQSNTFIGILSRSEQLGIIHPVSCELLLSPRPVLRPSLVRKNNTAELARLEVVTVDTVLPRRVIHVALGLVGQDAG
jgi:hypothetical protein